MNTVRDGCETNCSSMLIISGNESNAELGAPARTLSVIGIPKKFFPGFSRRSGELSSNPADFMRTTMPATEALDRNPTN